jgi:hypothetical protein
MVIYRSEVSFLNGSNFLSGEGPMGWRGLVRGPSGKPEIADYIPNSFSFALIASQYTHLAMFLINQIINDPL